MNFSKDTIIERKLAAIRQVTIQDRLEIPVWETKCAHMVYRDGLIDYERVEAEYSNIRVGETWECSDDFTRWFRARVTVPDSFAGKPLALNLELGGEGIVRVNGQIISAITSYLDPKNIATRTRVFLADAAVPGQVYEVEVEAHTLYMEFARLRIAGAQSVSYTLRAASLDTINPLAESYYFDILTAFDGMKTLRNPIDLIAKSPARLPHDVERLIESFSKDTYYYDKVKDAILHSITSVDFDMGDDVLLRSLPLAQQTFRERMAKIGGGTHAVIKFVGQAHIDTAWLWPVRESVRKSAKTLSNVCSLMDKYPEFTFAFSQPQLFEFVKDNYPELYERVKEKVKSGQFELVGNTWVEMDTNIPSGESLVRQILYGRQYFLEEFGKCSDVFWMPDVFGYSWALPQIIKRSGMKYFFTSKLINNDDNRFPHSLFQWQGTDGTRIPAYLQRLNYNGMVSAQTLDALYSRFDQKDVIDESLMTFGFGDGGGGPSYQMLETARRLTDFPGLPKLQMDTSESFFKDVDQVIDQLPVWNDEMYYEFHRGTYTSQADVKKGNRKSEFLYRAAEMASAFAHEDFGQPYPYKPLLKGYKKLLTNQFHDIMPGSSITPVYVDARKDYAQIQEIGTSALREAVGGIAARAAHREDAVVLFNFLSWDVSGHARLQLNGTPFESGDVSILNELDEAVPSVVEEEGGVRTLVFRATAVPAMGYACYHLTRAAAPAARGVTADARRIENEYYRIELDENANFTRLYDKRARRELLAGPSNLLKVFEDKPGGESAWNIDPEYQNKEWALTKASSVEVLEAGGLRARLRVRRAFNKSTFVQDIQLYAGSDQIEFLNSIDWYETEKMLKAEFNLDILSSKASYEIQFGAIERPTHQNTSYDRTKFEVSAHKWADLSENGYGVSLLNDCKYGYDILGGRMRITLMRSPNDPDPIADKGHHEFVYALRPHKGGWAEAGTVNAGYQLNAPLLACYAKAAGDASLPARKSYLSSDCAGVIVDTIKCAEDGDGVIVRAYEATGRQTNAALRLGFGAVRAQECNLVEENERELALKDGELAFTIRPFEVKTFRLNR